MVKLTTVEARERFGHILNKASYGRERIIITRRGEDLAAVMEEFSRLELEVDESALVSEFAEAHQQAMGRGKTWFVAEARQGRWPRKVSQQS